jgi:hypothetical protein
MISWPFKDPNEVLDYEIDWAARIGGDTISTVTWTVPGGITKNSDALAGDITVIWLSGGTAGTNYDIGCRVVTTGGRTYDETVTLNVSNR